MSAGHPRAALGVALAAVLLVAVGAANCARLGNAQGMKLPKDQLPDAPASSTANSAEFHSQSPCQVKRTVISLGWYGAESAALATGDPAAAAVGLAIGHPLFNAHPPKPPDQLPCPIEPIVDWYARFLNGPQVRAMTPKQKAWLAVRDVADPFNAITILGSSAITVGANSHSPYGPGMTGFGRYVGVSYSQDVTGEFFGTFLIPSLVHQDPHYHRMPGAGIQRRIAHCIYQVVWTQGDSGRPIVNYADLAGFAIDDAIGNLYVPGQQTNFHASAVRYATGLGIAPVDNFITEFLPDIARRIHVRVVLIQQIINQVARTGTATGQQ